MNPPPTPAHQRASFLLARLLDAACPSDLVVLEAVGVRVPDAVFVPDVIVADRTAALANRSGVLDAEIVELVVEIVSPGSRSMDRLTKPSLYAQAGVGLYWRVELQGGPWIHTYRLEDEAYGEEAMAGPDQPLEIREPFPVAIRVEDLAG